MEDIHEDTVSIASYDEMAKYYENKEFMEKLPEAYERLLKRPNFLIIKAKKNEITSVRAVLRITQIQMQQVRSSTAVIYVLLKL